jgi:hypothetical protein
VKLSILSLAPSAIGVALVMSGDLTGMDVLSAGVCFAVALGMCWAGDR